MKCVVINGTEQKGCTYNLKEIFLDELKPKQLTEFYLSKDAPQYCTGCKMMQISLSKKTPEGQELSPDLQHWINRGWVIRK